jgi:pyrroloquinoline quinone biosynthesis protein D
MNQAPLVAQDHKPRLQSFVRTQYDPVREVWVVQAPERILVLDETGKAILDRCDGAASVAEIIAALAEEYDAPPGVIAEDVQAVLNLLAERNFLIL